MPEILYEILSNLDLSDLIQVRQISKQFYDIGKSNYLLELISHRNLLNIINNIKRQSPLIDGREIEEYLNLVWGNSFFETYKLTSKEYIRELNCLLSNPSINNENKDYILQTLESIDTINPEIFDQLNTMLIKYNIALFTHLGKTTHYTDVNQYGFNFSGIGLTRLLIEFARQEFDIDQPLASINVSNNAIKNLPETLWRLLELFYLNIKNNEVEEIPKGLQNLKQLQFLNITENRIPSVSASNRVLIQQVCSTPFSEILATQKGYFLNMANSASMVMHGFILPFMLLKDFTSAHLHDHVQTDDGMHFSLPRIISEPIHLLLSLYLLTSMVALIYKMLDQIIQDNHLNSNLPYREDMISHFSNLTLEEIPTNTEQSQAYLIGRQSSQSWSPYFNSFVSRNAYSRAYYAGLDDERNNLPSRIQGTTKFKEVARRALEL